MVDSIDSASTRVYSILTSPGNYSWTVSSTASTAYTVVAEHVDHDYNDEMKIKFEIEIECTEQDLKEFGDVDSFIEEMIDQNVGDFNDPDMWTVQDWVAVTVNIRYNNNMKQLITDLIKQIETESPDTFDEQQAFELVMEMIVSEATSLTYKQYKTQYCV